MITDTLWEYIYKYYISGIVEDTSYNPVDTITYAILLGISIFWVLRLLEKLEIEINTRFIVSVTPYILAGSSLRVLEDAEVFAPPLKYLFITPIIYFFMFGVTISILIIGVYLQRKGHYNIFFHAGIAWTLINIAVLMLVGDIENPVPAITILTLGALLTYIIYLISKSHDFTLLTNKLNVFILFAHMFDAPSTFIGIEWLGYYEKHVVPTFIINLAGNFIQYPSIVMYPLKLLIFIPVLYMLGNEEEKLINLMKLTILVLGLSPATRNTLRILIGV